MALTKTPYANRLPQANNIQGFWRMEEESGVRADLSDNANTLQDNNTVLYGVGKIGNAADFELTNSEYLSITDALQTGLDITGEITICTWIKPETVGTPQAIVSKYSVTDAKRAYSFYVSADGKVRLFLSPGGAAAGAAEGVSSDALSAATLYHIGATLNQTTDLIQVYINGLPNGNAISYTSNIYDNAKKFMIGAYDDSGGVTNFADALIDETIVWRDKCLTAAEMLQVNNIRNYSYGGLLPFFM